RARQEPVRLPVGAGAQSPGGLAAAATLVAQGLSRRPSGRRPCVNPMRELILLRHAHAEAASAGQADLDRPLSPEGLAEAEAAGRWLLEHGLVPDCVLCSPARRTRETLEAVLDVIGYVEQRLEPAIYEATPGDLLALAEAQDEAERLLLVGHNPGLERLLALMHSGQSGDYRGMPPGAIAVLWLPGDTPFEPGIASPASLWRPLTPAGPVSPGLAGRRCLPRQGGCWRPTSTPRPRAWASSCAPAGARCCTAASAPSKGASRPCPTAAAGSTWHWRPPASRSPTIPATRASRAAAASSTSPTGRRSNSCRSRTRRRC